jgi:hypothetical protein
LAECALLGEVDLRDWAEDGDLVRAEIRLLPIVNRFAADPDALEKILGNNLSQRLREFILGRAQNVDALRGLLADLRDADGSPPAKESEDAIPPRAEKAADEISQPAGATIDRIARVDWSG